MELDPRRWAQSWWEKDPEGPASQATVVVWEGKGDLQGQLCWGGSWAGEPQSGAVKVAGAPVELWKCRIVLASSKFRKRKMKYREGG